MIFQPTPIIFLTTINRLVFVMMPDSVLCEVRTRFLGTDGVTIQTKSISHSKSTGGFHGDKEAGSVKLNTRLYLGQRLRSGAEPPLLHMDEFMLF